METEHIVETNAAAEPTTRTTIIRDHEPESPRSGGGWVVVLLAVLILGAVAYFAFGRVSDAEIAKDDAVAEAAGAVGNAADNVSEAATNAGAAIEEKVDSVTE
ncbi:MAG: PLDc N-terminal domain-containing protein [Alteraurantiacibacter sp.]